MANSDCSNIGKSPLRREDRALVTGRGQFTDDVRLSNPLHVAFCRCQIASGQITGLDLGMAQEAQGVVGVHAGAELAHLGDLSVNPVIPIVELPGFPVLAGAGVCALGQPIAGIVAETLAQATEAAEAIHVDMEDSLVEPYLVAEDRWQAGDFEIVARDAAHVIECSVRHPRLAPSPMEPRAIAIAYRAGTDSVTVWHSTQTPHRTRRELASILGIEQTRIQVIAPDVGGAFGMKASLFPEDVFAVWAAFHHKRDVKWTASRSDEFLSATHGRGVTSKGWLALDRDGRFLALKAEIEAPIGCWVPNSGLITAWNAARILPTGYDIKTVDVTTRAVRTNLGPTGIYRGAGRPEANCLMERLVDKAARITGQDAIDIRRRNLVAANDMPHTTATGNVLDSGDYARALTLLETSTDYPARIAERDKRRAAGELVGIGIGFYVEPSGSGRESAAVTLAADGSATVASGSSSQGHGRQTAYAQIAADALAIHPDAVTVILADTAKVPEGIGALASRSTAIGGSAVQQACSEIAERRAKGEKLPITAELRYENKGQAWAYGAYFVTLSVDGETGVAKLEHVSCVDDTGTIISPASVNGQILGGFAQGLGEALMEAVIHDEEGQLVTGSFMDYALPRANDVPPLEISKLETPSPMNLLGAKGVGEAGTIGAPAAILNAAIDALSPLGVTDLDMPLTSQKLWHAIQDAGSEKQT